MAPLIRTIVIGSFLEPELVRRIEEAVPKASIVYEPNLLPVPRYGCDHTGVPRVLDDVQLKAWRESVREADAYFDFDWLDPVEMPVHSPKLRWVQATSSGIGAFMQRTGLNESSLQVTTASGIHAIPLSEYALMGALHFSKGLPQLSEWKAAHHWQRFTTHQLAGRRVLVIGLGGIGRQVATSFHALGVEVWGLGREGRHYEHDHIERVLTRQELDDALPHCDVVVVCCPLTPDTEGLLGPKQLTLLHSNAVIVNVSRGQVIDQSAMIEALREHRIAGACLDVFWEEPLPADSPLWELDNVVISPHSASTVSTENAALVDLFLDNLDRFESGSKLRNLYDRERGY